MEITKKVPAFTLLEITVAMLIAAIVIGITYTAFHIVSGTYLNYNKKQQQVATLILIDQLLKQDFEQADHIKKVPGGLQLISPAGQISYVFESGFVLRNQLNLQTDTFKIPVLGSSFYFEKNRAVQDSLVDELFFDTELDAQKLSYSYQKTYSASNLLN